VQQTRELVVVWRSNQLRLLYRSEYAGFTEPLVFCDRSGRAPGGGVQAGGRPAGRTVQSSGTRLELLIDCAYDVLSSFGLL
jgi:hypothetical protein